MATSTNLPRERMYDDNNISDSTDEDSTIATHAQCNSPSNSTSTSKMNFNELVTSQRMIRDNIETTAATGQ
jgi:hypothetical protein